MNQTISVYTTIKAKVSFFFKQLKLKIAKSTGRTLKINPEDTISLALFKQSQGIPTKKSIYDIFDLEAVCSYKTLVVNLNRLALYAAVILQSILRWNQSRAHAVKHTDTTDIPVCLVKNATHHKTMRDFAAWGRSAKGWFYGLKLGLTADLRRSTLSVDFSSGNTDDRKIFRHLNKNIMGLFVADAGFVSKDLEKEFYIENKRVLVRPQFFGQLAKRLIALYLLRRGAQIHAAAC